MPAVHTIDHDRKLIITTWEGEPSIKDLANAFKEYQQDIRSKSECINYSELVDFSGIGGIKLNSSGLRMLADIAAKSDKSGIATKLAIIVKPGLTFGLARMYQAYSNSVPWEFVVFRAIDAALAWLDVPEDLINKEKI